MRPRHRCARFAAVAILEVVVLGLGDDVDVLAAAVHGDDADAGGGALRERRAAGRAGAVVEAEDAAGDVEIVVAVLDGGGEGVRGADPPVDADGALQRAEGLREAVPLAGGLHKADLVPRGGFVGVFGAGLHRLEAPDARAADGDGEAGVDRARVVEVEGRLDELGRVGGVVVPGAAIEGEAAAGVKHRVDVVVEARVLGLEAAARDQVDRAAEAGRGHVGGGDLGDLDAGDVVHRHLAQVEGANSRRTRWPSRRRRA